MFDNHEKVVVCSLAGRRIAWQKDCLAALTVTAYNMIHTTNILKPYTHSQCSTKKVTLFLLFLS